MTDRTEETERLAGAVAEERAKLEQTVRQIQHRLTPGQLIDEVLRLGGESGRAAAAKLGKTAVAHPVPMILMGAALVWLALEMQQHGGNPPDKAET